MPIPSFSHTLRAELLALWRLAWPMLIGQVATIGMSVADVAMAGHASAADLAAVSLGSAVWCVLIVTLMGIMMSVNPSVAHHLGAGEQALIPPLVRQALWKGLLVGLIGVALSFVAVVGFDYMALDALVRDKTQDFLRVIAFSLPAFGCYRALYGYSASVNQTKPMMVIALLGLLLNILLNAALIFGLWGMPRMGGVGCAVATLVCVWFNLIGMVWWIRRAAPYRATYPFDRFAWPDIAAIGHLLHIGLPIGVTYFAEASAFSLIALLVAQFGTTQVAAHQIALNFSSLVFMVPLSLGTALITRVGLALGEGRAQIARFRAWVGVGLSLACGACSAMLMGVLHQPIAAAYTSDLAVARLAGQLLVLAAVFQLSDATQVAAASAIRGYKVTRPPMLIHLTAFWLLSLPLGYVLGIAPTWLPWRPAQPMMATGFWLSLIAGLTVAAVMLVWFLQRLSRQYVLEEQVRHGTN